MRSASRLGLVALLVFGLGSLPPVGATVEIERPDFLLDPTTGEIDGKRAMAVYAAVRDREGAISGLREPEDCAAYVDPVAELAPESQPYPCAEWFLGEEGMFWVWAEGPGWVSPEAARIGYAPGPFDGRGMSVFTTVSAAGLVRLGAEQTSPEHDLWLLRLHPARSRASHSEGFLRVEPSVESAQGVQVAAGEVVAGLWHRRRRELVALTRPFRVAAGETVAVGWERESSAVFLLIERPLGNAIARDGNIPLRLVDAEGAERTPDLFVGRWPFRYAVWYDVVAGPARLDADAAPVAGPEAIPPVEVEVRAGELAYLQVESLPRPSLEVELDLPVALDGEAMAVTLRLAGSENEIARRQADGSAGRLYFEGLPLAPLTVALETAAGSVEETVDLSDGADGFVRLGLDPVVLEGTVFYSGEEHAAKLTFGDVAGDTVEVASDDDGRYRAVLVQPVRQVTVSLIDEEVAEHVEFFFRPIATSRELDFHLSATRLGVTVVDAVTGSSIPGATLLVRSDVAGDADDESRLAQAVSQSVVTGDEGHAFLPPPRPGRVEVTAVAQGYERPETPLEILVTEDMADAEYPVRLNPTGATRELRLLLPTGEAAAGARVIARSAGGGMAWSSVADDGGVVAVPERVSGADLVATHSHAALDVRPWNDDGGEGPVTWTLPPRAAMPLELRVVDGRGDPALGAQVTLWIGGRSFDGRVLALLADAQPRTRPDGDWTARGLPASAVTAVASYPTAGAAALEALATTIPYPWPHPVTLRVVD